MACLTEVLGMSLPECATASAVSSLKKRIAFDSGYRAVELVKDGEYGIPVPNYTDENVSTKVVKIIQSYVGIVNKMVWRK